MTDLYFRQVQIMVVVLLILLLPLVSSAQLKPEDITVLRERAQEESWSFTVGENGATGYAYEELCGLKAPDNWATAGVFDPMAEKLDLPAFLDWREQSGCTPVRNQEGCGSCWAFATVGVLECNIRIIDGRTVDLSEQWLLSCNTLGYDCTGGWFVHGYHQSLVDPCGQTGAVLEIDFPYVASKIPCGCPYDHYYFISRWAYVGTANTIPPVEAIKQAIMQYGPVAVAVRTSPAMFAYTGGIFNYNEQKEVDHGVVLVGWDDSQGTGGVWFMRNSWGPNWGEDGYMRIEYGCSKIGYGACYVEYPGLKELAFTYPEGLVSSVYPQETTLFEMHVESSYNGIPKPGTGQIHFSVDGSDYLVQALTEIEDNHYQVILPALDCGQELKYYMSAEELNDRRFYDPDTVEVFAPVVASDIFTVFEDDFETDRGWTVSGDAESGHWERGIPAGGDSGTPAADFDGSGQCFLTGNAEGVNVDNGTTVLTSPVFELTFQPARISYAFWFHSDCGGIPDDRLCVLISNDGGAEWQPVATVRAGERPSFGGWYERMFRVDDFVTPTGTMKLRFEVADTNESSCVEAAVDAVRVNYYDCVIFICGDVNRDWIGPDIADITFLISYLYLGGPSPIVIKAGDVNNSGGDLDIADITHLIAHLYIDYRALDCPR